MTRFIREDLLVFRVVLILKEGPFEKVSSREVGISQCRRVRGKRTKPDVGK